MPLPHFPGSAGEQKEMQDKLSLLKCEFRDLKLKIINGDINIRVIPNTHKSIDQLDFIMDEFPDDILSGSIALKMYGLLNRQSSDIDLIIKDKDRYDSYYKDMYGDEKNLTNRLGFRMISYQKSWFHAKREYKVDFFENKGTTYHTYSLGEHRHLYGKPYKIHDPIELISHKMNMASNGDPKHYRDLVQILKNVENYRTIYGN